MRSEPDSRAGRREWIGLAVIALPCLLYSMDLTVLNLAVPQLSADLEPSSSQLLWMVDIYGFLVAGSLITMGTLGDRVGRRRLLLIGAAAFGVASVLTAFSTSAEMLIGARALLGVAGATLAPSTLSLIRNMFLDPRQRAVAVSVWVASYSAGAAIGPLLGGLLLEFFWWGSVFLLGVPVMVLLLVLGPVLLPEYRDEQAGRLDLLSALQSLAAILAVIYGLKQIAEHGLGWSHVLFISAGLAVAGLFLRRQRTLPDPLIDLRLFRAPAFSASLAIYALGVFAAFGSFLFLAQYLQLVEGLSPLEAGVWTLPSSAGFVVGSMISPLLVRRLRPVGVAAGGLLGGAVGLAVLTQVGGSSGLIVLAGGSMAFAFGIALVVPLTTDIMIGTAPPERAGAASALSETAAEFGGAAGIAVLGSIGAAVYRSRVGDRLPADVAPDAEEAARRSLGGAVAFTDQLPAGSDAGLLEAARDAFLGAWQIVSVVAAAIVAGSAVLAALFLRGVRPAGASEAVDPDAVRDVGGDRPRAGVVQPETPGHPVGSAQLAEEAL